MRDKKVILKGHISVADEDLVHIKQALAQHISLTRAEVGCLVFEVQQDDADANRFNVYEEFSSQSAFAEHQNRVSQSYWGEITKNVSRHYQIDKTCS